MKRQLVHIVLCLAPIALAGQDVHFAQFYNAPLWCNPALAGHINGDQRLSLIHRDQWSSVGVPFRTNAFSYDVPLFRERMNGSYLGAGLSAFSDRAGRSSFGDSRVDLSLSYGLRTGSSGTLALGLQGGYAERSARLNDLRWDSQFNGAGYDPNLASGEAVGDIKRSYVDLGAGALWSDRSKSGIRWTFGAGAFHLNAPDVALVSGTRAGLQRRYLAHGELRITGKRWTWLPKAFYSMQGGAREINYGALLHRRIGIDSRFTNDKTSSSFYFGAFHRWGDAIVPTFLYEHKRMLSIGLSYEVNISPLRANTGYRGGAEVSVQWIGAFSDKRVRLPKGMMD